MRVDIYRRAEARGRFSYPAVPEGRNIPEEATSSDWTADLRGMEVGEQAELLQDHGMPAADAQLSEQGYAITSVSGL